jgi:hypothetical protein
MRYLSWRSYLVLGSAIADLLFYVACSLARSLLLFQSHCFAWWLRSVPMDLARAFCFQSEFVFCKRNKMNKWERNREMNETTAFTSLWEKNQNKYIYILLVYYLLFISLFLNNIYFFFIASSFH